MPYTPAEVRGNHAMGFHFRHHENVPAEVGRIASEQIHAAIHEICDPTLDRHEVVHQLRRRCKKLRGLLRLVRPWLGEVFEQENAFYRDLSRALSSVRDSQALLDAFDRLREQPGPTVQADALSDLRAHLAHMQQEVAGVPDELADRLVPVREQWERAAERLASWTICGQGFDALESGLMQVYRKARRALRAAANDRSSEHWHQWRKRVKYHWHHAHLLREISPRLLKPHRRMAAELGEILGQDHDLAGLQQQILAAPESVAAPAQRQLACDLIASRQRALQADALRLGQHLFAEKPQRLARRWRGYWEVWQSASSEELGECQVPHRRNHR